MPDKIFLCGTVRNCEPHLDNVFKNIQGIVDMYVDFRIIIAFDQSDDNSLIKLEHYKNKFGDKMDIIQNPNSLSEIKTENISNARNAIIRKIREYIDSGFDIVEWKHFIMMDMDDICSYCMNRDVFTRALIKSDKWDAVSFNRVVYYDLWALSIDPFIYSCWGWKDPDSGVEMLRSYITDKLQNTSLDDYVECRSAFGGFAIYKTDKFIDC